MVHKSLYLHSKLILPSEYIVSLDLAVEYGQDLKKIQFKDQSWLGLKTRSRKCFLNL